MYAFISHSNRNMEQADTLRELFRRFGIDTWMAPYDIPASCSYMEAITQAISECGCFVLLLTKEAEASEHVNKEISVACNYVPREIVPISLGHVPVSKNLEYALANIQYKTVRKLDEYDDEMRKILQQVRAFLKLPEPPRQKPQRFALEDISVVDSGRYLYLGPGINQISIDRTSYFLYDKEKETIDLVYLSGLPAIQVIASIKCDPQDVLGSVISLSTDGRYFLLRTANKLSVADIYANPARWVAKNKPLPVKRGEDIFYISWPKRDQFDLICGTVDGRTIRILAQIEMSVKPYAYLRRAEIKTEQPLGPLIGFRELNQIDWQLFHTADDRLIAWNPKDKVSEPGVNILKALQAKRPALPNGIDQFSPDDLMYYLLRPIGQLDFLDIMDAVNHRRLLRMPGRDVGGFELLEGYRAMIYNRISGVASIRDFQRQEETVLATPDFFKNSEVFYHELPFSAVFDSPTGTTLYLVISPDDQHFRVVAVAKNGAITAISEEAEHRYDGSYIAQLLTVADGCLAMIMVEPGNPQYRDNAVNTFLYHFKFHREYGRLIFDSLIKD